MQKRLLTIFGIITIIGLLAIGNYGYKEVKRVLEAKRDERIYKAFDESQRVDARAEGALLATSACGPQPLEADFLEPLGPNNGEIALQDARQRFTDSAAQWKKCAESICYDTDEGRKYHQKGYVISSGSALADFCDPRDNRLYEGLCLPQLGSAGSLVGGQMQFICPNGCDDGACKPATVLQATESATGCYDSDPYDDTFKQGYVTLEGVNGKFIDSCTYDRTRSKLDKESTVEYNCYQESDGHWVVGEQYPECLAGHVCKDGRCQPK